MKGLFGLEKGTWWLFAVGLFGVLYTMVGWWTEVVREANRGDHTPVVSIGLRYGMILFIASEVMFFVGWFWAFFDFSLFPSKISEVVGGQWPPKELEAVLNAFDLPLLNTLILLCSGCTVTWAHHALLAGYRQQAIVALTVTVLLAAIFTGFQAYEYFEAPFDISDGIYGSTFFMATGFHGFHVIIGTIFLAVCLVRLIRFHFTKQHHFGFEAAAWYWHMVDVVWLFLFVSIYYWGGA